MTFPSLQSATEYLQSKIQDFYNQRGVLVGRLKSIQRLKEEAAKTNNHQAMGQLGTLREGVLKLLHEQITMEDRFWPYAQYFGAKVWTPAALGALPVVLAGGAIAVAAALYLHYEKLQNQAKALDLVAKGILPADKAESILNPSFFSGLGGSFASVGVIAVGGLAVLFFLTRRTT